MDFVTLREALRTARDQVEHARDGRKKIGLTLDEAAAATGLNRATIHSIENVKREPALKPELETIERLVYAYRMTLSSFFARIEGLKKSGAVGEDPRPLVPPQVADDDALQFDTEERIQAKAFSRLARAYAEILERNARKSQTDHRLSPEARPLAAERSSHDRKARHRNVPREKKRRPPKK